MRRGCTPGIGYGRFVIGPEVFEVELKFAVIDAGGLRARLAALGAAWGPPVFQCDQYFAHPSRDFSITGEALRLRTVGEDHILTFKGAVLDRQTKTRREIETDLASTTAAARAMKETLMLLGFRSVRKVEKERRTATLTWQNRAITCAWDEVPPLGTYLELEIVTDDAGRAAAADAILSLAAHLQLPEPERRSYLKLLLTQDGLLPASSATDS